jgi:tetratricopeptide (TPR) repeat protein
MEPQKLGEVYNYLGLIEESVGNDKQAIEDYERSILLKNLSSINNISRVYIAKGDLLAAESYLKIGLQRIRQNENTTDHLLDYQLHRNLGWAYVEGKRYKEAEVELKAARKISSQHLDNREYSGKAMGSCFLGHVYEQTDRAAEAEPLWARCRNSGRPETIDEYRAIVKFKPEIAQYIDTTGIF